MDFSSFVSALDVLLTNTAILKELHVEIPLSSYLLRAFKSVLKTLNDAQHHAFYSFYSMISL